MKLVKGFLLLELLIAAFIICLTGVTLSRTFSKEIELYQVSSEYDTANVLALQKMFDVEMQVKIMEITDVEGFNLNGTFDSHPKFTWMCDIQPHSKYPNLYELKLKILGLKNEREINYTKWILLDLPEDEDETEDENNI